MFLLNLYISVICICFGFRVYARYASQFTLHENEIQSTKDYVRNYKRFMQNKPNLVRRRRIAYSVYTTDYENKWPWRVRKNKPNSNPIKANFQKAQMNVNSFITKDYRKNDVFAAQKTNPIQTQSKPNSEHFFR